MIQAPDTGQHLGPTTTLLHTVSLLLIIDDPIGSDAFSALSVEVRQFVPWLIKTFQSHLAALPHLRVVEVRTNLSWLTFAVELSPEIAHPPTFGGRVRHFWGCHWYNFADHKHTEDFVGIDPVTLKPTG